MIEDYTEQPTAPRVYVRAGQDRQPFGLGDLVVGLVWGAMLSGPLALWALGVV
mgnify:CR=1 FL=1|jgi:hypothetical protein